MIHFMYYENEVVFFWSRAAHVPFGVKLNSHVYSVQRCNIRSQTKFHPYCSDVNKDLTFKAKDKDKDQTYKDKDQDKDQTP